MKMDGEGCENTIVTARFLPPCVIEVHDGTVLANLRRRFGLTVLPQKENWIAQNFLAQKNDDILPQGIDNHGTVQRRPT